MSLLCLAVAGSVVAALPVERFTLAWVHSVEKLRWEEDYAIVNDRLALTEARIRGSGAGMEPPPDAILRDGIWRYRPAVGALARLELARSKEVPDYELCLEGDCRPLARWVGGSDNSAVSIYPCPAREP